MVRPVEKAFRKIRVGCPYHVAAVRKQTSN